MTSVTVRAPAKINLGLSVGGPRADGFHDVATAYHAISLQDELVAAASEELSIALTTADGIPLDDVPQDRSNLAVAAALALAERAGVEPLVRLHVTKSIPVAGGMAGGSADAAAALVACDALWQTGLSRSELAELAAALGSDVPFSLVGGTALGTGRGEVLTPVLARGRFHWVVAIADGGLSTPDVYAECDRLRGGTPVPEPRVADALMAALRTGDADALGASLHNDLQAAACSLRPSLRETLETGAQAGALGSLVSGSGPSVVFLARSPEHAIDIAVALSATGTCRSVRRAHGPVAGARVVGDG
ncbi:MAG: 4-diphosphocytidyl-2-C-methyl-D-erythritol kinase [Actinomycetota bacterium]|jgi:4-diphosphocytidyl-2-C-methyl-D-erythritol kinase|nr:4-diphosphocytidyl-2-C-methyl-D-erythritol kinase [Actinomycetota bacterium]